MLSYSSSLLLENIALSLTFRTYDFPSTLADAGYTDPFIEYAVTTTKLKRISYDFGVAAPERNRSLVSEMKGGQYGQSEEQERFLRQLADYAEITAADLVNAGFRVAPGQDPRRHEHEVVIVGVVGEIHHIEPLVDRSPFQPAMLAAIVDDSQPDAMPTFAGLTTHRGALRDSDLVARLGPLSERYPIPLPIPFDPSSQDADIAATIMPAMLAHFSPDPSGSFVTTDDILRDVIDAWDYLGPDEQRAYHGRVKRVIRHGVAGREFRGIISWVDKQRAWRLEALPAERGKRQTRMTQLQRKVEALVARMSGIGIQEPLGLDEFGADDE